MSHAILKGGCLCGAVKYEVSGEPARFFHCHCSRCRKASGTGHASNLFVQRGVLTWLAGEGEIRSFKVPEAKRFTNVFCGTCGGRLPRRIHEMDAIVIPCGSLDDDAPIKPQARIFYDSRASWSCGGDALSVYPGAPQL